VFGANNIITDIIWNSRKSVSNDAVVSLNHNYTLIYAKNMSVFYANRASFKLPDTGEGFDNPDNDPRGVWKADPLDSPGIRPNLTYAIINPNTGAEYWPPEGRCWRTGEKEYKEFLRDERIVFGKTGNSKPQLKRFLSDAQSKGLTPKSIWDDCGTTTEGTKEIQNIFGSKVFDTPKPTAFVKKILELASDQDSIVLDFFSGSATTAHAVMQLNAEDGGHRKFILVQLPEVTDEKGEARKAGFKTICDIGEERIRRAGKKILEGWNVGVTPPQHLHQDGQRSLDLPNMTHETSTLDIGFRVFRVDSSNMKDVYYRPNDFKQGQMEMCADNIKEDRTPEDLLFQVMLDLGILLSSKIQMQKTKTYTYYDVADGYLIACFDKNITDEIVTEIAKQNPYYAVFRDSGITSDSVMTNFEQIFETYSPKTQRKVL
jgi:adenine-specific DNA-methyltransferase